jgi:hypothetical protein
VGVLDDRIVSDVGEVRADESERVRAVHLFDLIETVRRLLVGEVAAQPVDGVGRVRDDVARLQRFHGAADLPRFGMIGIHREDHDSPATVFRGST